MPEEIGPTKTRGGYRWTQTRRILRGREQKAAKLTDGMVSEIRALYIRYDRELGATALGRRYGVSRKLIEGVVAGVRWKHVEGGLKRTNWFQPLLHGHGNE